MSLFDTHAHLDDEQLVTQLPDVLQRARDAGVERVLAIGTTARSSETCLRLAQAHEMVGAAVGIQPNYGAEMEPGDWERVVELAADALVVAIGETGLDRYWDYTPWDVQVDLFQRHLQLATTLGLPFVVHMRDCESEIVQQLQRAGERWGPLRGVMHSFTGTWQTAEACLELGLHISFAGMVTFKKSNALREVARQIPADRLLIETDAPYLSPHPQRGQRPNEPALIVHTAACLADVRGCSLTELARLTTQNAQGLFRRS